MMEEFISDETTTSPIGEDSPDELSITQLSLPSNFDESLCLDDIYQEYNINKGPNKAITHKARHNTVPPHQTDEPRGKASHNENDLDIKISQLLAANLELSEKGRLFDTLKNHSNKNNAEIEELRSQLQHHISLNDTSATREKELQNEIRDQAQEQAKLLRDELNELRSDRERKDAENSDYTKELERQLSDVRSDLKVKCCELFTLKQEFARVEETVRQKDDALIKNFYQEDLLVENIDSRRSLVKNSVALARKCRELQSQLNQKNTELVIAHEQLSQQTKKEESNQRLFKDLTVQSNKSASAYIISAVKQRDAEIVSLGARINSLKMDLNKVSQERDELSSQLNQVLERRDQMDEIKGLLEAMQRATASVDVATTPLLARNTTHCNNLEVDDGDMFEHCIHRSYMTLSNNNKK